MSRKTSRRAFCCGITYLLVVSRVAPGCLAFAPPGRLVKPPQEPITPVDRIPPTRYTFALLANNNKDDQPANDGPTQQNRRKKIRRRVKELAKNLLINPITYADSVRTVLSDATFKVVDMAVDEVVARRMQQNNRKAATVNVSAVVDEAFAPLEDQLQQVQKSLDQAEQSIVLVKSQAIEAIEKIQAAAVAEALEGAVEVVEKAEEEASRNVLADIYASTVNGTIDDDEILSLAFEDVDYRTSEMAPPFLDEDQCLVPGEPVVRVEKAPENSRRIFAGIDVLASVDDVWEVLTDYSHLQDVVPNLVVNKVLEEFPASKVTTVDTSQPDDGQCQELASQMKGSLLRQVGGAKIAGINFSARTTLEVREWPQGLPDFAHFREKVWQGKTLKERAEDYTKVKLQRYMFPRPFAVSTLPTRDITMQSVMDDDGEFRMYQGVWRMQPLPGCAPPGKQAMRLTYAVEVSPRAYLPVRLVEGRIVRDLCDNLIAIRDFVGNKQKVNAAA